MDQGQQMNGILNQRVALFAVLFLFIMGCSDDDPQPPVEPTSDTDAQTDVVETDVAETDADVGTDAGTEDAADSGPNPDSGADADTDASPPVDDENLLFADDFSSGDMAKHNDYFRWTQGAPRDPGTRASSIVTVEGPRGQDVQARRFQYIGTEDGGEGDDLHFSEQRFALTTSVDEQRSRSDTSNTAYPEVWFSYWMRVPNNYHHHLTDGTTSGANKKGWLYLWKDRYEKWQDSVDDEKVTPTTASLHWWPTTENQDDSDYGMTRTSLVATRGRSGWGHDFSASFTRPEEDVSDSDSNFTFLKPEYGTWVHYTFGIKVASADGADDGFVRIYKGGELAVAWEDSNHGSDEAATNGFDRGYLMGYHNPSYTETTTFLLTDFKFGLTQEAVAESSQ
jgi:hypothetical protein